MPVRFPASAAAFLALLYRLDHVGVLTSFGNLALVLLPVEVKELHILLAV